MQTISDTNTANTIVRNEKMSQVTLRKGYWFYFDHNGNDISMHGSAWSGKETVYFNNKAVSSFRNISSRKSEHKFIENGHQYKLSTNMKSLLRGTLDVSLYCDDLLVKTESVTYTKDFGKTLPFYILLGVIGGFLAGYFDLASFFS